MAKKKKNKAVEEDDQTTLFDEPPACGALFGSITVGSITTEKVAADWGTLGDLYLKISEKVKVFLNKPEIVESAEVPNNQIFFTSPKAHSGVKIHGNFITTTDPHTSWWKEQYLNVPVKETHSWMQYEYGADFGTPEQVDTHRENENH
jgi:hypothetical protein